jgi:hypothetical protein
MQLMEKIETKNGEMFIYTEEQLMARLKFFIGICLALTLTGIVFVVLYSLIFVTQPMNAIAPIDQKFFELIIPIATFLTGTLSGIMLAGNDKDLKAKALDAANKGGSPSPSTPSPSPSSGGGFSASGSIGGANFSFNKSAAPGASTAPAAPSAPTAPAASWGTTPIASAAPVKMSSTGKPMPVLEDDEEL